MKRLNNVLQLLVIVVFLSSCASTTPVAKTPDGNMVVTAFSSEKKYAVNKVYRAAVKVCKNKGKELIKIDDSVEYQGALSEELDQLADVAGSIFSAVGKDKTSQAVDDASSGSDDYKATLTFDCG